MIVASIAEILLPQPTSTRPAPAAQVSNQSPQTFSESLLAVSKASSGASPLCEGGTKAGRRQKSVPEDAKPRGHSIPCPCGSAANPLPHPPLQMLPQQVLVAQQSYLFRILSIVPMRLLEGPWRLRMLRPSRSASRFLMPRSKAFGDRVEYM